MDDGLPHLPTPGSRASLNPSLDVTRNPAPIKVPGLWLDFLIVHIAIPRPRIQGNETFDGFKPLGGRFITPCPVLYELFVAVRGLEVPVRSAPFPFTERCTGRRVEGDGEGRSGYVVCWTILVIGIP